MSADVGRLAWHFRPGRNVIAGEGRRPKQREKTRQGDHKSRHWSRSQGNTEEEMIEL